MSAQTAEHTAYPELPERKAPTGRRLATLSLTALGVVYGDIGTSPLYALRECFRAEYGIVPTPESVLGILSLIVWSLILVVSVKYIVFILRADSRGEGGILALLALLLQQKRRDEDKRRRLALIAVGLFGAALLYGDGVITPAISVLGAIEGLEVNTPALAPFVTWISLVIVLLLFMVQRFGTASVGTAFGPIMLAWFASLAALGVRSIIATPTVLLAINPWHGVQFFFNHGLAGFLTLGAVVLCVTGAEALYADMGHFGKRPIRLAWFVIVLPALVLNYFGQGALLLRDTHAASNPFYLLAPKALLWPLLIIALSFLRANVVKIEPGGWVPIALAAGVYTLMSTWKHGRAALNAIQKETSLPLETFLTSIERNPPVRVRGTAVFMTSSPDGVPVVLLHHLKHNKVLHETVVVLSIQTHGIPEVPAEKRVTLQKFGQGFYRLVGLYGFMQSPNVPELLAAAVAQGVPAPPMETSYY